MEKQLMLFLCILLHKSLTFDLPRENCKSSDLSIDKENYNNVKSYKVRDAFLTDAHYDNNGNLFYVEYGWNENGFYFDAKMIVAGESISRFVIGLPKGISYSIAVDRRQSTVYFGTGKGMYKYDYNSESAFLISDTKLKLDMIFVDKDSNKYITESKNGIEELYLLNGEKKIRFHKLEALNELGIDDKNNFFFIKENKLFVLKSALSTPVCIGNVSYDGLAQISFHKETVFVASENLMFKREQDETLNVVPNIPGKVTAIAFDVAGNFVLGVPGKLLRYEKTECYLRDSETIHDIRDDNLNKENETKTSRNQSLSS